MKRPMRHCSMCGRLVQFPINRLRMRGWWTCQRCDYDRDVLRPAVERMVASAMGLDDD